MTYKSVACIGSRSLPPRERSRLAHVARVLESLGYTLRSGGAWGSDAAFEAGLLRPEHAEVYLPAPGFNSHASPLHDITPEAFALAERFHPAWHRCNDFARRCHARNSYQVLGRDLASPARAIVCWTPGAMDVGGTAQALRIARHPDYAIPVYNLADPHASQLLAELLRAGGP